MRIPTMMAAAALAATAFIAPATAQEDGTALLARLCGDCHSGRPDSLSRIEGQRKTPEGWLMTIVRMRLFHDVDITAAEQQQMVHYLSDTQGLAPEEAAGYRYILEREPAVVEDFDQQTSEFCARCHSGARVALQRRTAEEWSILVDFHLGQWPTAEYQALGRDREWYKLAKTEVAPKLAETYPFETEAWTAWKAAAKADARGEWMFITRLPGVGETYGRFTVSGDAQPYTVIGSVIGQNGVWTPMQGKLNVYSGYEWRASVNIGGENFKQVLEMSANGNELGGRQFLADEDALGGRFTAARVGAGPKALGVVPSTVPAGGQARVQIVGTNVSLSSVGGTVTPVNAGYNNFGIELTVNTAAEANGLVHVVGTGWDTSFGVYSALDSIKVEPSFGIARVGGGGGRTDKVKAMFQAVGYLAGPDGQSGTDDDIRIGEVPAIWSIEPFDEVADELEDVRYAGEIDGATGIFTPAVAGPNSARPFSTNNAGNLKIVATNGTTNGSGQLIVTVQRWNDPPIR
ncbi:MAG: quinohemoprotein amine dehydrogenase subunit alpha [Hyphomicrobiales bacterium]|nr:quinohemoprotein amine dehydrogenase subunit alpha [Hyphomicrobiales bacterium]